MSTYTKHIEKTVGHVLDVSIGINTTIFNRANICIHAHVHLRFKNWSWLDNKFIHVIMIELVTADSLLSYLPCSGVFVASPKANINYSLSPSLYSKSSWDFQKFSI